MVVVLNHASHALQGDSQGHAHERSHRMSHMDRASPCSHTLISESKFARLRPRAVTMAFSIASSCSSSGARYLCCSSIIIPRRICGETECKGAGAMCAEDQAAKVRKWEEAYVDGTLQPQHVKIKRTVHLHTTCYDANPSPLSCPRTLPRSTHPAFEVCPPLHHLVLQSVLQRELCKIFLAFM